MMRSGLDPAEEREGPIFLGFTKTFSIGMLQISGEPSGLFVSGERRQTLCPRLMRVYVRDNILSERAHSLLLGQR